MKRIMVVEDSHDTLNVIVELLQKFNYKVVATAVDGESAIKTFIRTQPDLVLLDLALPKKDGLDVMRDIFSRFPDAKIIVISALYKSEYRKMAIEAGCVDFVLKPFEVKELINPIERALSV